MNKYLSYLRIAVLVVLLTLPVFGVHAQLGTGNSCAGDSKLNPLCSKTLTEVILSFVDLFLQFMAMVLFCYFIFAGFSFVKARGNPEEIEKAKRSFFYAVIGAGILLGAKVIATIVQNTVTQIGGGTSI